jgi:hypothetical protein
MGGVKLGEIRQRNFERISFKEWCLRGYVHSGQFPVRVIFPPNKFPSFSLVFQDDKNGMEVRMSIQAQKFKEAMNALGLSLRKTDLPAIVVEVEVEGDGVMYGLDIEKGTQEVLEWRGSYWLRRKKESEPWDENLTDNF